MFLLWVRRRLCMYICDAIIMGLSLVIRKLQALKNKQIGLTGVSGSSWKKNTSWIWHVIFDSRGHQSGLVHFPVYSIFWSVQPLRFSLLNVSCTYFIYVSGYIIGILKTWKHQVNQPTTSWIQIGRWRESLKNVVYKGG